MTELRIDERIAERYADLSPQERRAADVLLTHLDDLAIYRAAELAELAGVSKATMSRLFRHLGFDDFGEVREHLRGLRSQGVPVTLEGAPSLMAHLEHEVANLQSAISRLDESHLDTAANL
ncbi:MAG: transcriptional regulator, RpiR family, partial [Aeromicrobium sp.]|nr:transcriptional regulator, RpiR family [Aeromicrobium sp.]